MFSVAAAMLWEYIAQSERDAIVPSSAMSAYWCAWNYKQVG